MTDNVKREPFIHPNAMHIYTDGSFRPGDNAACAYLIFSERTKHIKAVKSFAFRGMTINQMELMAINKALDHPSTDYAVIYSDSTYAISCLTLWHKAWETRDWKTPLGEPVKNRELIEEICKKIKSKKFVRFLKVRAHSGDPFNSLVDHLASGLTARMVTDPTITFAEYEI